MIGKCKADFVDKEGQNCKRYASMQYCTPNGDIGKNWHPDFGKFEDYGKDGYDARSCPECGCKGRKTNN